MMNMVAGGTVGSRRDGIPAAFSGSGLVAYLTIQNTQEEAESEQHCGETIAVGAALSHTQGHRQRGARQTPPGPPALCPLPSHD